MSESGPSRAHWKWNSTKRNMKPSATLKSIMRWQPPPPHIFTHLKYSPLHVSSTCSEYTDIEHSLYHRSKPHGHTMYRRTAPATSDLSTLEARGAAFVSLPRPRHSDSSVNARARQPHPHHSLLSRIDIFGITAYGVILIAAALTLAIGVAVLVYTVVYLFAYYT